MQYKYAKEQDFSDLSSGRVLYSLPGHPAFPVRLASEIFQRCLAYREEIYQTATPCTLYDPCAGAAYHLTALGYLHREQIRQIIASDIDEKAVALAERNLSLLHRDGLDQRIHELSRMLEEYGKESHREAMESASTLRDKVLEENRQLATKVFRANATDAKEISKQNGSRSVDIVFTDVPYGHHSQWQGLEHEELSAPLTAMLSALWTVVSPASIVAIVSDKQQKAVHEQFTRLEHFQVGKRRVVILKPLL